MIANIKKVGRKWIAETDAMGILHRTQHATKTIAQEWIDSKEIDAKFGDASERLFSAAIVKGLVEHDDGTVFFGSTVEYNTQHFPNAVRLGYVTASNVVTAVGMEWYERCLKQLSQSRQVFWTDGVGLPAHVDTVPN